MPKEQETPEVAEPQGLDLGEMFADLEGTPSEGGDGAPEPAKEEGAEAAASEELAIQVPEEPAAEGEPPAEEEEPAAEGEPAAEEEPGAGDEPAAVPSKPAREWDKDRQKRDQEAASRFKNLETKFDRLTELVTKIAERPGATAAQQDTAQAVDAAQDLIARLDGESNAEELAAGIKQLAAAKNTPGIDKTVLETLTAVQKELKELKDEKAAKAEAERARALHAATAKAIKDVNDHVAKALNAQDLKHEAHRGEVMKDARADVAAWMKAHGYSNDNKPTADLLKSRWEIAVNNAARKYPRKTGRVPAARPAVKPDPGSGGVNFDPSAIKPGNNDEVGQAMLKKGWFKP